MIGFYTRRLLLVGGALAAVGIVLLACGLFGLPSYPGLSGSILSDLHPLGGMATLMIALLLGGLVGGVIAGRVRFDAGVFCAAFGLLAYTLRGGRMQTVLFADPVRGTYLTLAIETAALFGTLFCVWLLLDRLRQAGWVSDRAYLRDPAAVDESADQKLLATLAQAGVMAVLALVLCKSDDKRQVLAGLLVASYLATLVADRFVPARPSPYLFLGPGLVGVAGYVVSYFTASPGQLVIGQASGLLAALARPLPVDYASAGVIAALAAYWTAERTRATKRLLSAEATAQTTPATAPLTPESGAIPAATP